MVRVTAELFRAACRIAQTASGRMTAPNLKRCFPGAIVQKIVSSGALLKAPHSLDYTASFDDEERSHDLQRHEGGWAYLDPRSGWVRVDGDALRVYQVSYDWLVRAAMDALGMDARTGPQTVLENKIWALGTAWLGKRKTPVVLGRRLDDESTARALCAYLQDKHARDPALVLAIVPDVPPFLHLPGQSRPVLMGDAIDGESQTLKLNTAYLAEKIGASPQRQGFAESYRTCHHDGQDYTFSKMQAAVMELLHKHGKPMNLSHNSGFTMVGICDSIVLVDSQTKTKRQKCQNLLN
ncbi:MAG: hypothetical protein JKP92_08950 [Alphaproteobacteria bacterium]|jgi:hypothetical protein|nr:hypothetical protein [Alphaproteobacteria bacterium]